MYFVYNNKIAITAPTVIGTMPAQSRSRTFSVRIVELIEKNPGLIVFRHKSLVRNMRFHFHIEDIGWCVFGKQAFSLADT